LCLCMCFYGNETVPSSLVRWIHIHEQLKREQREKKQHCNMQSRSRLPLIIAFSIDANDVE
jgi:hypothetical protein